MKTPHTDPHGIRAAEPRIAWASLRDRDRLLLTVAVGVLPFLAVVVLVTWWLSGVVID